MTFFDFRSRQMSGDFAILLGQIKQRWLFSIRAPHHEMYQPVTTIILAMLATMRIDDMDAVIDSIATRLGRLPRDIRDYVLRPMLWEDDRYLGFRHRNGYLYGVRDTAGLPHKNTNARCLVWMHMGTFHRAGGRPAKILVRGPPTNLSYHLQYWENGYLHRESGPACVGMYGFSHYRNGRLWKHMDQSTDLTSFSVSFAEPSRFKSLYGYSSGSIYCSLGTVRIGLECGGARLFFKGTQSDPIPSPILEDLRRGLVAYLESERQANRIAAEWAQAQSEAVEAARLWAEL